MCVVDIEATRHQSDPRFQQEIVELPAVLLDTRTDPCCAAVFKTFVKPTVHPKLNYDTTSFMPITQADVDAAPTFPHAMHLLTKFVELASAAILEAAPGELTCMQLAGSKPVVPSIVWTVIATADVPSGAHSIYGDDSWSIVGVPQPGAPAAAAEAHAAAMVAAVTTSSSAAVEATMSRVLAACDGPWDITCYIAHECVRKHCASDFPPWMKRFWNIRKSMAMRQGGSYRGLHVAGQLGKLGMSFWGTEHSGVDDSVNIARIAMSLLARGGATAKPNESIERSHSSLNGGRGFKPAWLDWALISCLL